MSIISDIIDPLTHFSGPPAYTVVGSLAFAEAAIFVGFVLPGETAVILGGVLASQGSVSLTGMIVTVVLCAIAGDSVGFEVGKHYGTRILESKIFAKHTAAIDSGRQRLLRLGGKAVFIGRFTAFLRAVMPGMAGTVRMPYREFLIWNAAGGIVWGTAYTLLGYSFGASYKKLESYAGWFSEVVLGIVVVLVLAWAWRRRRREHRERALTLHLASRREWELAQEKGVYTGSTRDADLAEVGFIHTSTPEQLTGVLERYYSDVDRADYCVLVIDTDACEKAGSPSKWDEVPGSDQHFLHIYGPVPVSAVVEVRDVPAADLV